jgi:DNA-directed RNA polymerase I, II, and III subunit RPABC1
MSELIKLYRVRKTLLQLLADRGYASPPLESFTDFSSLLRAPDVDRAKMTLQLHHATNSSEKIIVVFPNEASVGIKTLVRLIDNMKHECIGHAILVVNTSITSRGLKGLDELPPASNVKIECFRECDLVVNVSRHALVPKHSLADKKAVMNMHKVSESQIPKMHLRDPIARYYDFKLGDVIRIDRPSDTTGVYTTYRIIV